MKRHIAFVALLAASPAFAQQTGVSRPPDTIVEDVPLAEAGAKPSAAVPATAVDGATAAAEVYTPYQPTVSLRSRVVASAPADPDAGIVTDVPRRPNELPVGTLLRMRLRNAVDTDETQPNTPFLADLSENVESDGRVVLPAGSTVEGVVTQARGGRRIRGHALIHLQAQAVLLPDGTRMPLRASVIDTDQYANTRVDEEGNILRKDHVGGTLAAMSLATGGAAAAGGVIGGPAGALIGAGIGAGVGTAWWLKQDRQARLPQSTLVVLGLTEPLEIRGLVREPNFSSAQPVGVSPGMPLQPPSAYAEPQSFVPTN